MVTFEDSLMTLIKLSLVFPYNPNDHAPWYLPNGFKNLVTTKTCTQMFKAVL